MDFQVGDRIKLVRVRTGLNGTIGDMATCLGPKDGVFQEKHITVKWDNPNNYPETVYPDQFILVEQITEVLVYKDRFKLIMEEEIT